ncbi:uncharacterized protein [Hoplias malabaricus]|uniref:uncharacterized protein isoform X2 n=1 Tax=Hoplias malabaricus TaxID=27720 RepID=UPI0034635DEC
MAARFLRFGRLSEQRLRLESSFGIIRGTPAVANFSTKAGNSKKPVRYTSIKKAKPKTIIDVGKLLLQRASEAKVNKQSVIAEAALKAATHSSKPTALELSPAWTDSGASTSDAPAAPSSSETEQMTAVAAKSEALVDLTPKPSDVIKPRAISSHSVIYDATKSVEQDKAPENTAAKGIPPEASVSLDMFPHSGRSLDASTTEMPISPPKTVSNNAPIATPETLSDTLPIDVTYSEDVSPISDVPDIEIASAEPSVAVLSTASTVTSEIVSAVDGSAEVFLTERTPTEHTSTKGTPAPDVSKAFCHLEDATSKPLTTSEVARSGTDLTVTQTQDVRSLADPAHTVSPSKVLSKHSSVADEMTPEVSHSVPERAKEQLGVSPVGPFEDAASQEEERILSSECISKVTDETNRKTTTEILGYSAGKTEGRAPMTERVRDLTPETAFEASVAQSHDPENGECDEEELRTEGEEGVKSLEAKLDPIQKLFLDKIHEYSKKSNSSAMSLRACDGLVDADPEYEKAFSEELNKLQRFYGNGDLTAFPEFKFQEPVLDDISSK